MKNTGIFLFVFLNLGVLHASEQIYYANLPQKIYFKTPQGITYIRPADLGSQEALNSFLASNIINNAFIKGKGLAAENNQIEVSVSPNELKAFTKFIKNIHLGQAIQMAYQDAFDQIDGVNIMRLLQIAPEFLKDIQDAIGKAPESASSEPVNSGIGKRKREDDEQPSKAARFPSVLILRKGEKLNSAVSLSPRLIEALSHINDSLIAGYIENNIQSGEPILIELPERLSSASPLQINDFFNVVLDSYNKINLDKLQNIETLKTDYFNQILGAHILLMKITTITRLQEYLDILWELADFFGYDLLAEKLATIDFNDISKGSDAVLLRIIQSNNKQMINVIKALFATNFIDANDTLEVSIKKLEQFELALGLMKYDWLKEAVTEFKKTLQSLIHLSKLYDQLRNNYPGIDEMYGDGNTALIENFTALSKDLSPNKEPITGRIISPKAQIAKLLSEYFKGNLKIFTIIGTASMPL